MPVEDDEDTFCYTELLDRSKATGGNNRVRMLRSFHHRSRAEFLATWPTIKQLCDQTGVRAYTRLSPRSYAKVGKLATTLMVEAALVGHYKDMAHIYARACGRVSPSRKLWLLDVDNLDTWADYHNSDDCFFETLAVIPSRKGVHVITKPFDIKAFMGRLPGDVSLHKDNPTNLYIPAGT